MTNVLIKRELLERIDETAVCDGMDATISDDLFTRLVAALAAPRQPEGEGLEVVAWINCAGLNDLKKGGSIARFVVASYSGGAKIALCRLSDAQRAIAELREECERLRMQLAACGVVALANTPESASEARQMHQDYMSASCSDVAGAVDREMTLRQQLAERDAEIEQLKEESFEGLYNAVIDQRDKLAGLLREVRVIVAREVERWTRSAAILPVNANIESGLLARIDAALAEVKPCPESPHPAAT